MDAILRYEKNQKGEIQTDNKRNGHSPKTLKASMGNSRWMSPGTATASLNRNWSPNTSATFPASKKKSFPCMPEGWARGISMTSSRIFMESNCLQKWSTRLQTNSFPRLKNGSPAPWPHLPFRFYGLHPLQSAGRWTHPQPCGLRRAGSHHGRVQTNLKHQRRGQRDQ